jgi:hypothetical protein
MEYLYIVAFIIVFYTLFRVYRKYVSPDIWDKSFVSKVNKKFNTDVVIFSAYDEKFSKKDYVLENF